ncbi:MAG TPA: hypothetical protein VF616_01220 [Duganella sp.]|uniref:hypothetical protein n=1 Tax=Duganella sp. TaxID=1904440 RepID=UPI002ED65ABC
MKFTADTGKPDFARYSPEQLRQILTRIDTARYPERVEEIERRLAAAEALSNSAGSAAQAPLGERTRISSDISLLVNRVVPAFGIGIGLVLLVSFIFSAEKQSTGWLMLVVLFVLGMLGQFAINRYAEEVFLVGDALIVIHAAKEEVISLTTIDSVEVVEAEGISVVLHVSGAGGIGQRIEFVPATGFLFNPFTELPVVDELRARIAAAKARSSMGSSLTFQHVLNN